MGHCSLSGREAQDCIRVLGKRLGALHIHDNDKWHDSHQIPFSMNIDFVSVVKALKEINYDGYFTLEASSYLEDFSKDRVVDGVTDLYNSAVKLKNMFEE